MYERAISGVLCKNMLLYFAYCDFEEARVKYEKVHTIYQKLLEVEDIDPTLVGYLSIWFAIILSVLNTVIRPSMCFNIKNLKFFDPLNMKSLSLHIKYNSNQLFNVSLKRRPLLLNFLSLIELPP